MLKRLLGQRRPSVVMGYRLREPRATCWAGVWAGIYFGLPLLWITVLIDIAIEWLTGRCIGLWCYFG